MKAWECASKVTFKRVLVYAHDASQATFVAAQHLFAFLHEVACERAAEHDGRASFVLAPCVEPDENYLRLAGYIDTKET